MRFRQSLLYIKKNTWNEAEYSRKLLENQFQIYLRELWSGKGLWNWKGIAPTMLKQVAPMPKSSIYCSRGLSPSLDWKYRQHVQNWPIFPQSIFCPHCVARGKSIFGRLELFNHSKNYSLELACAADLEMHHEMMMNELGWRTTDETDNWTCIELICC